MTGSATLSVETPAPAAVEWLVSPAPVPYEAAVEAMEARVAAILQGRMPEAVWLLEHPPLYTAGTSAAPEELLEPSRFPVFRTGRGGRFTYHGPGQRVAYVMLDLSARGRDVRAFVHALEDWLIATLARLGVEGERREGQIGVFVGEAKIASIGVRAAPLGELPWREPQRRSELGAFRWHRALRADIASDQPRSARGGCRHAARRRRASRAFEEVFGALSANACR